MINQPGWSSILDHLTRSMQSPLFLAGAQVMGGGGADGLARGFQQGTDFQAHQKRLQDEQQQRDALQQGLAGLPGLSESDRTVLGSNPELGGSVLQDIYRSRFDPMAGLKKRRAEQELQQGQAELDMLPLKRQQIQSQIEQGRNGKYGLQPIYGRDEAGNPVVLQLGASGEAVQSRLPNGVSVDVGLKSQEQALGTERGKAMGLAQVSLPRARYNAKKVTTLLDDVLNDKYLPAMTGPIDGLKPNVSAAANRIQSKLDQLEGQSFLQAFESLKGAGQITEIEGQKATNSLNRLRTLGVGTEEYVIALREFRQDVADMVAVIEAKANGQFNPQSVGQTAPETPTNDGWSIKRVD